MNPEAVVPFPSGLTAGPSLLPQFPGIGFPILLIVVPVLIVLILWFIWRHPSSSPSRIPDLPIEQLSDNLSASTRPLFLSTESSMFNMVRLAVQDRYLVLAKLPLSSVLTIEEKDRETRKAIMKAIQPIHLDLALIHPGSLQLEKIIRFTTAEAAATQQHKEQLVAAILESAGIETITLEAHIVYTVPQLLTLLGLGEEE